MADLDHISRTALEDAKSVIGGEAPLIRLLAHHEGVRVSPFNYGFIIRNPEATGAFSDILCESPLLHRVRKLVYQRPSLAIPGGAQ